MKKSILNAVKLAIFFLPVLLLLAGTNYICDPGNVFQTGLPEQMAKQLQAGYSTGIVTANFNENECKAITMDSWDKAPDYLVLGPSLSITISSEMANSDSFYNLSMSGANYNNFLDALGRLDNNETLPKTLLWCFDTMMFDKREARGSGYPQLSERFINRVNGQAVSKVEQSSTQKNNYASLFSLSYFQASVQYFKAMGAAVFSQERIVKVDDQYTGAYWRPDGAHVYDEQFQNSTVEQAQIKAEAYGLPGGIMEQRISSYASMDKQQTEIFEKTVAYLQSKGVQVILFLCPFHPTVWDEIESQPEKWSIVLETNTYIQNYAQKNGVRLIGSFDPEQAGCTKNDFYDERHMRAQSLDKIFDFSAQ